MIVEFANVGFDLSGSVLLTVLGWFVVLVVVSHFPDVKQVVPEEADEFGGPKLRMQVRPVPMESVSVGEDVVDAAVGQVKWAQAKLGLGEFERNWVSGAWGRGEGAGGWSNFAEAVAEGREGVLAGL